LEQEVTDAEYKPHWFEHVMARVGGAKIIYDPFPHIHILNIFPNDFYARLLLNRGAAPMEILNPALPQRRLCWLSKPRFLPEFWADMAEHFLGPQLREKLPLMFGVQGSGVDAQLIHDAPGYQLGPHTDEATKAVTGLFYLPDNSDDSFEGTRLYISKSGQECDGSVNHKLSDDFVCVTTIPFWPNSALFFPRTNWSFHGVALTQKERWLISHDILK
jgi:hypothetical protein